MTEKAKNYIFGPVPSRRLGRSLGVDLVPFKTCSYDCIYCQLGRTTNLTVERKEWVELEVIIEQLKAKLDSKPDYITLSGSGEPTLYSRLEELIARIKEITDVPVAVLTNGSLLWMPEVRSALKMADLVVPSLDAGSEYIFEYVNRAHPDITFEKMLGGLIDFRKEYDGQYWLEVFFLAGVSITQVEIEKIKKHIETIQPDRVQINTVTRPPAEEFAESVSKEELESIAKVLFHNAEVIADYDRVHKQSDFSVHRHDVLTLLQRRPCSIDDIASGLGLHRNEVIKYVEQLSAEGKITAKQQNQQLYYQVI